MSVKIGVRLVGVLGCFGAPALSCDDWNKDGPNDTGPDADGDIDADGDVDADGDADGDADSDVQKSCKRGVAYGHHSPADLAALAPGISWWYNWYFAQDSELGDAWKGIDVVFVPMRWGKNYDIDEVAAFIPSGADTILGFNEPNFFSQADLSATEAASLWLTEFACSGSPSKEEQKAFLEDAVAYLENEPRIARYAWFSGRADNMTNVDLLRDDGALTELGDAYVHAPFSTQCPNPF